MVKAVKKGATKAAPKGKKIQKPKVARTSTMVATIEDKNKGLKKKKVAPTKTML
jgi:hypothetical protein